MRTIIISLIIGVTSVFVSGIIVGQHNNDEKEIFTAGWIEGYCYSEDPGNYTVGEGYCHDQMKRAVQELEENGA